MDTVDAATRSRMMRRVRQRDTGPELTLRSALHRMGLRYRLHRRDLPGRPDIVFPRYQAVVFVHGCFWHRHDCKYSTTPATRSDFWIEKFEGNVARDLRNVEALLAAGWRVLVVWECRLKGGGAGTVASSVARWLDGRRSHGEI